MSEPTKMEELLEAIILYCMADAGIENAAFHPCLNWAKDTFEDSIDISVEEVRGAIANWSDGWDTAKRYFQEAKHE